MNWSERITHDPAICKGRACVKGTRIMVSTRACRMKFKIDQNLPLEFETILAASGHDAISVFNQGLNGAPEQTRPKQVALLKELLPALASQPLQGKLWIVEEGKLRVRG